MYVLSDIGPVHIVAFYLLQLKFNRIHQVTTMPGGHPTNTLFLEPALVSPLNGISISSVQPFLHCPPTGAAEGSFSGIHHVA